MRKELTPEPGRVYKDGDPELEPRFDWSLGPLRIFDLRCDLFEHAARGIQIDLPCRWHLRVGWEPRGNSKNPPEFRMISKFRVAFWRHLSDEQLAANALEGGWND